MKLYFLSILLLLPFVTKSQEQDSLDIMIGQMIMAGVRDFQQTNLHEELLLNLDQGKIGGVVLFEKNVPKTNTQQGLVALIDTLQSHSAIPLFVSIDEEGGIVNRLKPKYGFDDPPSAQQLGEWDNTDTTYFYARRIADNLKTLGFNLNYAPVVDLNVNPKNPIIGGIGRSFSEDYREVVEHASVYIEAHRDVQVGTTLKHFPGHGSSAKDTHKGIADVSKTFEIEELYPYKMLIDSGLVDAVMTSHVMNRVLADSLPGTLSKRVVNGLLRDFLGFDGVVFSDDMQMKAIADHYGLETSVKLAILAGVDILVFANNVLEPDVIPVEKLFVLVKRLVTEGEVPEERIRQSYQRIMDFKVQLGLVQIRRSYEPIR